MCKFPTEHVESVRLRTPHHGVVMPRGWRRATRAQLFPAVRLQDMSDSEHLFVENCLQFQLVHGRCRKENALWLGVAWLPACASTKQAPPHRCMSTPGRLLRREVFSTRILHCMSYEPLKLAMGLAGLTPVEPYVLEIVASVNPPPHRIAAC